MPRDAKLVSARGRDHHWSKPNGVKLSCIFRRLRFEFWLGQEDATVAGSEDQPFPETKDYREVGKEYRSLALASMGNDSRQ